MTDPMRPTRLEWPRLRWKRLGGFIVSASVIATFLFFLLPTSLTLPARLGVVAGLLALVCSIEIVPQSVRAISIAMSRIWYYPKLYLELEEQHDLSRRLRQKLIEQYEAKQQGFRPNRVHWFRDRQEIYLLVHKRPGRPPEIGEAFDALDKETFDLMAELELVAKRPDGYYMKIVGYIHPVWAGSIRSEDRQDSPAHPDIIIYKGSRP